MPLTATAVFATVLLAAVHLATAARAQDTVLLAGEDGTQPVRVTGTIVEFNGRHLKIELQTGREAGYATRRVVRVETTRSAEQTAGDRAFAAARFREAIEQYSHAIRAERRDWVRREIMRQGVWCYVELNQPDRAGDMFLLLVKNDPDTQHFGCVPLPWRSGEPPLALERRATAWLKDANRPVANLLGAGHLLSSRHRADAIGVLRRLKTDADPRVAALAKAQLWRTESATATAEDLTQWAVTIGQMPESVQAGPYFVLGRALVRAKQPDRAALALLRVPILFPEHRRLAAQSLLAAGGQLEASQQNGEAAKTYRELVDTFGDLPEAARARESLDRLDNR